MPHNAWTFDPGNDDAARAVNLYCDLACRAALEGMSAQLGAAGVDLGAMEDIATEEIPVTSTSNEVVSKTSVSVESDSAATDAAAAENEGKKSVIHA